MKYFALILLSTGLAIGSYTAFDFWRFHNLPVAEKVQELWAEDVEFLEANGALPRGWSSIRDVEFHGDAEAKALLQKLQTPIRLVKEGKFRLEILMVPWEQDDKLGIFIQYDLIDLESKNLRNTVWEKSRTLIVEDRTLWYAQLLKL